MGANDKLAATFHPRTWECPDCLSEYTSPLAAAECCSPMWDGTKGID